MEEMCLSQTKCLSKKTPKFLTVSVNSSCVPLSVSGVRDCKLMRARVFCVAMSMACDFVGLRFKRNEKDFSHTGIVEKVRSKLLKCNLR
jgi:hypothetical protein